MTEHKIPKLARCGVIALLALGACAPMSPEPDAEEEVELGSQQEALYVLSTAVWTNRNIPVCWETAGNEVEKTWVRQSVEQTWQRYTGASFSGWGLCDAGSSGIRIRTADEWPEVRALGNGLNGRRDGMVLNFQYTFWATDPEDGVWKQPFAGCINNRESCIRSIAVHEFGHALGFSHEHNRSDRAANCTKKAQGTNGDTAVGRYDAMSVMNYCNPVYNNDGQLSAGDISGAVRYYGLPGLDTVCYSEEAYTTSGVTCGDGANTALCRTGDVETSVTVEDGAFVCGPPRDRWPRVEVRRTCASPRYALCNPAGNPRNMERKDFNGDGRSDILWSNAVTGEVSFWYLHDNPGSIAGGAIFDWKANAASGWKAVGTGDFDQDGRVDILWHHGENGRLSVWFGNTTHYVARSADLSWTTTASTGWKVVGTGDFDVNGHTDVLWHHPESGELSVWFLSGTTVLYDARLSWTTRESTGWKVRGTGDFDGDGRVDVVWHNDTTGQVSIWYLAGTNVLRDGILNWTAASNGWELVGSGDYDYDNRLDLLWYRASDGSVTTWNLDGLTVKSATQMSWKAVPSADWRIVSR